MADETKTVAETPHNAYPLLKVVDYQKTTVDMDEVKEYIKSLNYILEVKRSALIVFDTESGNGKHGVNNNYVGLQADGARIGGNFDRFVIATCVTPENMTGKERRFCCFENFKPSIDYLAAKVLKRGLYVGGGTNDEYSYVPNIIDADSLDLAYFQDWVEGDKNAKPSREDEKEMEELYAAACIAITK